MKLNEHYVNVFKSEDKEKYIDQVIRMINDSYAYLGGALGLTKEKLMSPTTFFKLIRRGNKIVACAVYEFRKANDSKATFFDPKRDERKLRYVASDGSEQGKKDIRTLIEDDIRLADRGFWGEVSGKMENMYIKRGAIPIPNTIAKDVLDAMGKKVKELDSDGYHYFRKIGDNPRARKMLIGNANIIAQGLGHDEEAQKKIANAPKYDPNSMQLEGLTILDYVKRSMIDN